MIVTRSWLNEWIDLSGVTTDELCKTFNAIGLEVDSVTTCDIPEKIIVGEVIACEPHPDANKLSVCKVDIGGSIRQIVCGAANVRTDIKVPVATIGAQMPGGLQIKPVQLRGVDSEGMICSSSEIGLPKMEDGIMVLDESFGVLTPGEELRNNAYFADDIIEIELTANRGDCLSIQGVARDLSAAFNRNLVDISIDSEKEGRIGIGRIAQLLHGDTIDCDLSYRAVDIESVRMPALVRLRLAQIQESYGSTLEGLLFYATYNTGVILRAYDRSCFKSSEDGKTLIEVKNNEAGFVSVQCKEATASVVGVIQEETSKIADEKASVFIEASYISPDIVSRKVSESKCKTGPLYYRTSRGSEPDLDLGLSYFFELMQTCSDAAVYAGSLDIIQNYEPLHVKAGIDAINAFIGAPIDKTTISNILKKLGFEIENSKSEYFAVKIPRYRHDIVNQQDIVEEIVRLVGIDNIPSKPFEMTEAFRFTEDYHQYQKRREYRYKAAYSGFYESVHFVFSERAKLEAMGFTCTQADKELLNPIAGTLDTLRPTLSLNLLEAASMNAKSGQKRVALFEIGSVFDEARHESVNMAFVYSGDNEAESFGNAGRPESVNFQSFSQKVAAVIGNFELEKAEADLKLMHPYQCARILQKGSVIGTLYKLHPEIQNSYDLPATFVCEVQFEALDDTLKTAKAYSKYQASYRDLSIVVPDGMIFKEIAKVITTHQNDEVLRFYPVDRYKDDALGASTSLTVRFVLQSLEKTLEEEDITSAMQSIIEGLKSDLGLELR